MIGNKKQEAGDNSIQVVSEQGNVNITQGITFDEIEKVFLTLFEANFPKLVKEANDEALKNIKEMLDMLKEKIEINKEKIDILKISSPNIQYNLNKTMLNVGRKGKDIDTEMLTDTLISFFQNNQNDVYDLVLETTLDLIPRMTKSGILYLSMIYFYYYAIFDIKDTPVKNIFEEFETVFKINFEISTSEVLYLEQLGCITQEKIIRNGARLKQQLENGYKIDYDDNAYFNMINEKLETNNMNQVFLTPVGWVIALLNLGKFYKNLNMKAGF